MFIFISISITTAQDQSRRVKYHSFSGTLSLEAAGGVTWGFVDYEDPKLDFIGRTALEYYFPTRSSGIFSIRAFLSGGWISGETAPSYATPVGGYAYPNEYRTTITNVGGGVSYTLSVGAAVFPYIFVGASYLVFTPEDNNQNALPRNKLNRYDKWEENYHAEFGMKFRLADEITMNLAVGTQFSPDDNLDDIIGGGNSDYLGYGMVGFSYSFFTEIDSDEDGIEDAEDACPNTPLGVKVDAFGCPIDSDRDGVPDYKDNCPNTKLGYAVDEKGCAVDSDNDGVPNADDKCPNTLAGLEVNEAGCPDTDMDGVADNLDKCPNTPKNAPVTEDGCPKDSDNDGVPDYKDECENTPAGEQVDEKGCATEVVTITKKQIVLSGDTNFEFNKATLLPSANRLLDEAANIMKDNPETHWKIEGHTDAVGSESYNMQLSRERANSVVQYLVDKGVDRDRLELVPKGESDPIATNDTQEGRAMNRRVEIKLIEEDKE